MLTQQRPLANSGYEKDYVHPKWNSKVGISNNNCYAYAFEDFSHHRERKSVPGNRSDLKYERIDFKDCEDVQTRLIIDNRDRLYPVDAREKCGRGSYKVMMFVSSKDRGDFHFYKHHKNVWHTVTQADTIVGIAGFYQIPIANVVRANRGSHELVPGTRLYLKDANVFSHKRGWATGALLTDACDRVIKDPRRACRAYAGVNYAHNCGTYCVRPRNNKSL